MCVRRVEAAGDNVVSAPVRIEARSDASINRRQPSEAGVESRRCVCFLLFIPDRATIAASMTGAVFSRPLEGRDK